jgi:DNA-binding CsgD family transcriptional regulator
VSGLSPDVLPAARAAGSSVLAFRSGSELVAVGEALYLRLLVIALGVVPMVSALVVVAALARTHNASFTRTTALAAGLALLAGLALQAPARIYLALRRRPLFSLVAPLLAVGALVLDGVTYSPLSYTAAASIALPAFVCGWRWALAAATTISVAALVAGTLHNGGGALNSVGQGAVGYFVWALVLAGLAERFAHLAMQMPPVAPARRDAPPAPALLSPGDPPITAPVPGKTAATTPGRPDVPACAADLTAGQLQVLALLADGLRADEIARRLGITTSTVYRHVERAKQRAGVRSRSELVAVVIRGGMLPARGG